MAVGTSLVTQVTGQVWMRGPHGALSPVAVGMQIPANADVITATGASVQLQANGQPALTIGENRDVQVSADLALTDLDPSIAAAAVPADPDVARVLAALDNNADAFTELDATAADLKGGGGDGGSSFTRLADLIEVTTPLGLEYPRPGYLNLKDVVLAGTGTDDAVDSGADLDTVVPIPDGGDGGGEDGGGENGLSMPSISIVLMSKEPVLGGETTITTEDGITIRINGDEINIFGVDVFDPSNENKTYGPSIKPEVLDLRNGFADISNIAAAEKGYLFLAGGPSDYNFFGEYVDDLYSGLIDAKDNPWPSGPALNVSHAKGVIFEDGSTIYLPGSTTTETTPAYEEVILQVDARLGENPDGDESLSAITLSGFERLELISILDKDTNPLEYTNNGDGTVTIHNVTGVDMESIQVTIKVPDDVDNWHITASVDATKGGSESITVDDSVSSDDIVNPDDALTSLISDADADSWPEADTSTEAHRESFQHAGGDDQEAIDLSLLASADVSLGDVLDDAGSDQDMGAALDAGLPADQTVLAIASNQGIGYGDHAAQVVVLDQHQLLQQIVDAGKQSTDIT